MSEDFVPGDAAHGGAESRLHRAAFDGDLEALNHCLAAGDDPNWCDSMGEPPLFGAAGWGHADLCQALLAAGARHDLVCVHGTTALHWAARGGVATVRLLLAAGVNVTPASRHSSPIHWAAAHGSAESVEALLAAGAQPEVTGENRQPLHAAATRRDPAIARLLVEAGADPRAPLSDGDLPVDIAHAHGRGETVRYLKTVGPQIRSRRRGR